MQDSVRVVVDHVNEHGKSRLSERRVVASVGQALRCKMRNERERSFVFVTPSRSRRERGLVTLANSRRVPEPTGIAC